MTYKCGSYYLMSERGFEMHYFIYCYCKCSYVILM